MERSIEELLEITEGDPNWWFSDVLTDKEAWRVRQYLEAKGSNMPYISEEQRESIGYGSRQPSNPGELNYVITMELMRYLANKGPLTYQTINDCLGALEGAKNEFYRRIATPYEETKKDENGDCYL